jgi:hypothetical protein
VVLAQRGVVRMSNEITAIPKFLDVLSLKATLVTIDAMGTQKEIAQRIVDRGADYVLALKGNQTSLHGDATLFFVEPVCAATTAREAEPTPATAGSKSVSAAPPTQAGSSNAAPNGRAIHRRHHRPAHRQKERRHFDSQHNPVEPPV